MTTYAPDMTRRRRRDDRDRAYQIPRWLAWIVTSLFVLQTGGGGLVSYFGERRLHQIELECVRINGRIEQLARIHNQVDQLGDQLNDHQQHPHGHAALAARIQALERRAEREQR